jgi:hypothetical protein
MAMRLPSHAPTETATRASSRTMAVMMVRKETQVGPLPFRHVYSDLPLLGFSFGLGFVKTSESKFVPFSSFFS